MVSNQIFDVKFELLNFQPLLRPKVFLDFKKKKFLDSITPSPDMLILTDPSITIANRNLTNYLPPKDSLSRACHLTTDEMKVQRRTRSLFQLRWQVQKPFHSSSPWEHIHHEIHIDSYLRLSRLTLSDANFVKLVDKVRFDRLGANTNPSFTMGISMLLVITWKI